jgi:hypothetical protein
MHTSIKILNRKRNQSDGDYIDDLQKREADLCAEVVDLRKQVESLSSRVETLSSSLEDIAESYYIIAHSDVADDVADGEGDQQIDDDEQDDEITEDGGSTDQVTDSLSSILNLNAVCAMALFNLNGMSESRRRRSHTYISAGVLPYFQHVEGGHRGYCKNILVSDTEDGPRGTRCNSECRQLLIHTNSKTNRPQKVRLFRCAVHVYNISVFEILIALPM